MNLSEAINRVLGLLLSMPKDREVYLYHKGLHRKSTARMRVNITEVGSMEKFDLVVFAKELRRSAALAQCIGWDHDNVFATSGRAASTVLNAIADAVEAASGSIDGEALVAADHLSVDKQGE